MGCTLGYNEQLKNCLIVYHLKVGKKKQLGRTKQRGTWGMRCYYLRASFLWRFLRNSMNEEAYDGLLLGCF